MSNKFRYLLVFCSCLLVLLCAACSDDGDSDTDGDVEDNSDGDADTSVDGDIDSEVEDVEQEAEEAVFWPKNFNDPVADENFAPKNIHITWPGDPTATLALSWKVDSLEIADYTPRIWYSLKSECREEGDTVEIPFSEVYVAEGECNKYKEELVFKSAKAGDDDEDGKYVICHVKLDGLEANSSYYYRAGTWDDFDPYAEKLVLPNLSSVHDFTTALPKGSREKFAFISAGDSRGGYDKVTANIGRIIADQPSDFWIFNGDMTSNCTQTEWDQWFDAFEPYVSNTVLMPVQGNHEIFANVLYEQFVLPEHEEIPEENREHGWSFDYANLHVIGLDSNTPGVMEDQTPWLENDLKAASEDEDIDWIVVMFHHGTYSACNHGSTDRVHEMWVPLFDKYGVDMVFNGHDHNYERTKPIKNGEVSDDGTYYVVVGGFFAPGYGNGSDWWTAVSHHGDKNNYSYLEVEGTTMRMTAYSGDGLEVLDTLELTK